jgi:hypothetical protein
LQGLDALGLEISLGDAERDLIFFLQKCRNVLADPVLCRDVLRLALGVIDLIDHLVRVDNGDGFRGFRRGSLLGYLPVSRPSRSFLLGLLLLLLLLDDLADLVRDRVREHPSCWGLGRRSDRSHRCRRL